MIYIDPPYNTGNDFIYPDNFVDPLETYLEITGQKDQQVTYLQVTLKQADDITLLGYQ